MWLAQRELAEIRRGNAPAAGESMALTARNLGMFYATLLGVALAYRMLK